ncbi:MAG: prolipoprotein diacylglyceryl transferase [Oscillospiraceae bacterium]
MTALKNMPISFPGLFGDWEFTASPVCFSIGEKHVYWYGILIAAGLLLALLFCSKRAARYGLTEDDVYDMIIWEIPAGIVGARLYYVIFYYSRFQNADGSPNFGKMVALWDGGLAIYGTIIACMLVAFLFCRKRKIPMGAMTDLCVMGLLIGQAVGRWGNFMNREAFGAETTLPWRMRLWVSAYQYIEVHPTFLYESLWNLLGLALLVFVVSKGRRFDGENTWFYFLWYGVGRTWVEGLRSDSLYLFDWTLFGQPIRVSQALSVALVCLSACMLLYHLKLRPCDPEQMLVRQKARLAAESAAAAEPGSPDEGEPLDCVDGAADDAAQAEDKDTE